MASHAKELARCPAKDMSSFKESKTSITDDPAVYT